MTFSPQGKYFAWSNGNLVKIVSTQTWHSVCQINRPKICELQFSPQDAYLMTWEPFTSKNFHPTYVMSHVCCTFFSFFLCFSFSGKSRRYAKSLFLGSQQWSASQELDSQKANRLVGFDKTEFLYFDKNLFLFVFFQGTAMVER